jgi:4-amino-4-deoxy-L-arabinose transferase-like glycosyltransferase
MPDLSGAEAPAPAEATDGLDRRTFRILFLAVVVVAGLLRVAYVLAAKRGEPVVGDQIYYSAQAVRLADGQWFADPFRPGRFAADHPPLTALALAPVSWSDDDPFLAQRLAMAVYGTGVVVGIGLLVRSLGSRRAALIATALAAVYGALWMNDALMMSETFAAGAVVGVLLAVYAYRRRRDPWLAVAVGLAVGLAGLARAELLLLGPLLAIPLTLRRDGTVLRRRLLHLALAGGAAAAVVAPWVIRNQVRFEESTWMSTQDGLTLLGANCPESYSGPGKGFWILQCADRVEVPADADQSQRSRRYREAALDYVGDHVSTLPSVVAARLGRGLSLWQTEQMIFLNTGEGRETWASRIGLWQYRILLPLAAYGIWRWPARGPRWPLVTTATLGVLVIVALYGIPRFRIPTEVAIVVGAAMALDDLAARLTERWRRAAPAGRAR